MNGTEPIELGLTIPLQRHLGIKALPYGEEPDRHFCWDLHVVLLRGRPSLNRAWDDVMAAELALVNSPKNSEHG